MDAQTIADRYYDNFRNRGTFDDVPMDEKLAFTSPMMTLDGPDAFRHALGGLLERFRAIDVRRQACVGDSVVSVYDFDLGLPGGPVPMAEVLTVENGALRTVELIFDPARLAPPAA